MFLVDDIVYPKYLFEYSIEIPTNPKVVDIIELNGRTYEHIIKGDINNKWMVILSHSVGAWGAASSITVYEGEKEKSIFSYVKPSLELQRNSENFHEHFIDIALMGDKIFLLTSKGLSYANLQKENIALENLVSFKPVLECAEKLLRVDDEYLVLFNKNKYTIVNVADLKELEFSDKLKNWGIWLSDVVKRKLLFFL